MSRLLPGIKQAPFSADKGEVAKIAKTSPNQRDECAKKMAKILQWQEILPQSLLPQRRLRVAG